MTLFAVKIFIINDLILMFYWKLWNRFNNNINDFFIKETE